MSVSYNRLWKPVSYTHLLGQHLRTQQEYINEQKITVTDYQHYMENWVHEIKKPLSLMTLLLDNRKDEMSHLVHTQMCIRDSIKPAKNC